MTLAPSYPWPTSPDILKPHSCSACNKVSAMAWGSNFSSLTNPINSSLSTSFLLLRYRTHKLSCSVVEQSCVSSAITLQYFGILPCRSSLFRAGLVDDDICPVCKLEKQSLLHMLYNFNESLLFWEKFTQWWQEKFSETIFLSVDAILFGWHQNANNKRVLNYILIIAKYYIFTTSVCDNNLSFDCFLLRLNSKLDVLRTIAIKNKPLNKLETTWAPLS